MDARPLHPPASRPSSARRHRPPPTRQAFTLVELLAVLALTAALATALAAAARHWATGASRTAAIDAVVAMLERARGTAIETGAPSRLVIWHRAFPAPDALMIVRDRFSLEGPEPATADESAALPGYVVLTKWEPLPPGILAVVSPTPAADRLDPAFAAALAAVPLPGDPGPGQLSAVVFEPLGGVSFPDGEPAIALARGTRDPGGSESYRATAALGRIALCPNTGRARFEPGP